MNKKSIQGFTLLELLVVIVILGIVASVASFSLGNNEKKQSETLGESLKQLILLSEEEATLRAAPIKIIVDHTAHFYIYSYKNATWEPLTDRPYQLPLKTSHITLSTNTPHNTLFISESGELSPFVMTIQTKHGNPYQLIGETSGEMSLKAPSHEYV